MSKPQVTAPSEEFDEITYIPGEGDPVRTTWNGVKFAAHVPTRVSRKQTIVCLMPTFANMPDGTVQSRHVERRISMVELAKTNPSFMVNGKITEKAAAPSARVPQSPDEYRGYALRWIAASNESSAMDVRWKAEEQLRDRCGVNDQDIAYIMPFFEARHDETVTEKA
jgi:hypothetical protein